MTTAFQANAFQNNAFQIDSGGSSSGTGTGGPTKRWAVKRGNKYVVFHSAPPAVEFLNSQDSPEKISTPRIEYMGVDISPYNVADKPAQEVLLTGSEPQIEELEMTITQAILRRMESLQLQQIQYKEEEELFMLLMMNG